MNMPLQPGAWASVHTTRAEDRTAAKTVYATGYNPPGHPPDAPENATATAATTRAAHIRTADTAAREAFATDAYEVDLDVDVARSLLHLDRIMVDVATYGDTTGLDADDIAFVVDELGYAAVTDVPVVTHEDGRAVVVGHRIRLTDAGRAYRSDRHYIPAALRAARRVLRRAQAEASAKAPCADCAAAVGHWCDSTPGPAGGATWVSPPGGATWVASPGYDVCDGCGTVLHPSWATSPVARAVHAPHIVHAVTQPGPPVE